MWRMESVVEAMLGWKLDVDVIVCVCGSRRVIMCREKEGENAAGACCDAVLGDAHTQMRP